MIVGASGLIGGALMRAARAAGRAVVGTALSRPRPGLVPFDMGKAALRAAVPDLGANDAVFLLAGYISPAWIFANPDAARALNLDASRRIADEAAAAGARLVFMSTDQVFDGATGGYVETAAPRPLNLYGRLKAEMERHVLALTGIVARTGWNVGWEKSRHCAVAQCYDALLRPGARMAGDNIINLTDIEDTGKALLAPGRGYIQVDSYRDAREKALFLSWVLTAKTHFDPAGWVALFREAGYTGDYFWTITE